MKQTIREWVHGVGALTLGLITATSAVAADGTSVDQQLRGVPAMFASITTTVDSSPAPPDYNGPCSLCWADTDGSSDGSEATLDMYYEDDGQDFDGDLSLLLDIDGGGHETVVLESVEMDHQSNNEFVVDAGATWDWNDVTRVTVTAIPG